MDSNAALAATLRRLGLQLAAVPCRWTVISSAVVALHTGDATGVGDVDVLVDEVDAAAAFAALGLPLVGGRGTDRFRSRLFGQWDGAPLTVELFAGFELFSQGEWQEVRVETRLQARFLGAQAYVPAAAELAAMLRRFGRKKDLRRAEMLNASVRFPSSADSASAA